MRLRWLFPGLLSIWSLVLFASPAMAARLQSWRFNPTSNRLEFTTDSGVQPRAQLIPDPTRIVIDLPGTTLSRPVLNQSYNGAIREVRVGQFDAQTTRIVIELNSGYTVDPQQVQVQGATPTQWTVQLPTPQRVETAVVSPPVASPPAIAPPNSSSSSGSSGSSAAPPRAAIAAATQLEGIRITPDGFFLRTSGAVPRLDVERRRNRREFTIDLQNTAISPQLVESDLAVGQFGVTRVQVTQRQASPPVTRVTLELENRNAEWQATASNLGGVVVVPRGGTASGTVARNPEPQTANNSPAPRQPATIQSVELAENGTRLLITADQPFTHTSGWDRATASYQVTIPSARLASQVRGPDLPSGSSLLRVRLREENNNVVVLLQPATGVQINDISQANSQRVALALERSTTQPLPVTPPPARTVPGMPPAIAQPSTGMPRVPNSRVVVTIDAGHGGRDPGAVGINGLREKDVVLSVSRQVAALLEQQGVQVVMTRQDDREIDLEPRVQMAERARSNLFVSIHANAISMSRPDVNGAETYYYSDSGLRLARVIHASIIQGTGMNDRGVRQARFYVLRNTSMPAVLLELGFVTGAQDAPRLANPAFQSQMASAIARGILQYVQQNF